MDIFKLFYNHDQRLDKLAKRNANKTKEEGETTLQDFMEPDPTYSKLYLTGSRLKEEQFGLNTLNHYNEIMKALDDVFQDQYFHLDDKIFTLLTGAVKTAHIGDAIVISPEKNDKISTSLLNIDKESNVGHFKEELSDMLKKGYIVLYKEPAHHGFDLHIFSKKNIYKQLFFPLQNIVNTSFRFFSINSKRMRSEKHFYFETWTLDNPPHGAEEVHPETVI